eukprot:GHVU01170962.1.p1 GENE.GHVU01170962.1~~GHVU01170962.1.p1  ORF type:complete len:143 (+),score=12.25 GHVU01170962.1:1273-1701(+)
MGKCFLLVIIAYCVLVVIVRLNFAAVESNPTSGDDAIPPTEQLGSVPVYAINLAESHQRWTMLNNSMGKVCALHRVPAVTPNDLPRLCVSKEEGMPMLARNESRKASLYYQYILSTVYKDLCKEWNRRQITKFEIGSELLAD